MVYAEGGCKPQSRETGENGAVVPLGPRGSKVDRMGEPWEDRVD